MPVCRDLIPHQMSLMRRYLLNTPAWTGSMVVAALSTAGRRSSALLASLVLGALPAACDDYPKDPSGTYEKVLEGKLIVGYLHNPPWVKATGAEPSGIEPDLVRALAGELGASVVWVGGSDEEVLEALSLREIALVVGGLTRASPWSGHVAFTRPYVSTATVVAGPDEGLLEEIEGLRVAVSPGSPAAAWVEDADGNPVLREEAAPEVPLSAKKVHELEPGEHVKMTLNTAEHVVAVPPGENRWLIEVDKFFSSRTLDVREELESR